MTSRDKTLTAILAGGVLLASAAYGIGTQTGGGGASAASGHSSSQGERGMRMRIGRDHHLGLAALARKLGVSEDKLRAALEELRGEMKPPGDLRDRMAADLAEALGVSEDKVKAALQKLAPRMERRHRGGPRRFAAALAEALGIEASKVREVFRSFGPGRGEPPTTAELAQKLGVSEADLKAAFEKLRPPAPPRMREKRLDGRFAEALATELGLDSDAVKAALKKLRREHRAEQTARREAFAKALAEKLDIPVEKVLAALPKRGPGHPGPGGPGRMHHRFGGPYGPPPMARPGSFAPGSPPGAPGGPPEPEGGTLKF